MMKKEGDRFILLMAAVLLTIVICVTITAIRIEEERTRRYTVCVEQAEKSNCDLIVN